MSVWRRRALAAGLALALAARIAAIFTASVNWDEFALFHTADLTLSTGVFKNDGRPGLATLLMLPLVRDCEDEMAVAHRARLLWTLLTLLALLGLACWIAELRGEAAGRWLDAGLGVALLAMVPAFLDQSLQVRTDQLALAGGAWGGAALLASRRRPALALLAGVALGVGLLGSQKLVYVGALAALLAGAQLALARELRPTREALRALLALAGLAVVVLVFQAWVAAAFELPAASSARQLVSTDSVKGGLSLFEFYRNTIGWSEYREMLPSLAPHALLLLGLGAASAVALRRRHADAMRLALAWAVLALGLAVGLFHAAAFRYFWMILGVFPAVALALARGPILQLAPLRRPGIRRLALAGFWCLLLLPGSMHMGFLLRDDQAVQRRSLDFVHRNFDRRAAGFHPESALFCQDGIQPVPTYFSQHIYKNFAVSETLRERYTRKLFDQFHDAPVAFILQSFRLNQFPSDVRRFFSENYQPYEASVFVAGRRLEGKRGSESSFELIVPGRYRWLPFSGPQPVSIDGAIVAPGEVVTLDLGPVAARFVEDVPGGMLVLALDEPPGRAPLSFYP